ncbi:MAG: type II toxin-antitoxin system death-on-curing family toxin [Candidatus Bipolaricaulota bacterium]|nr:type II toxin-antitoxin system death-on-curing family toxin [Candidatus Bipolaricaulota bacterium]MDW8141721.1 type II toxin-antitoxin system death-on-curing family toxin [Candidatus Bipolaricaulota bacterium]
MRYLATDEVLLIHERILERSGGAKGIREWGLLDSAVQRPQATFGGKDLYADLFSKAAVLGHSLVLNHPFVDGNKRTAWEAMHTFIEENGYALRATKA